jgi:mannose-6-phosphate isomerase-like protein (cupin superfamily)
MIGYCGNIEGLTEENTNFRQVLYSGSKLQLVLMSIPPREDIGGEIHGDTDQFFRIQNGKGTFVIDGMTYKVTAGDGIIVPAGAYHNVICVGDKALKLYAIYGPPNHRDLLVRKTKAEAAALDAGFEGSTTEQIAGVVHVGTSTSPTRPTPHPTTRR